jgi:putative membrane protein
MPPEESPEPDMRHLSLLAAALLAAVCAGPAAAQSLAPHPSPELAAVHLRAADVRFLLDAVASGVTEVRAGELALERSHDPGVRKLAKALVHDHTQANARLLQIARDKGVAVPREPSGAQRGMLAALRGVPASAFDAQFLERAGVHAHREAIGLFHGQVLRADPDPDLTRFADSMLPVLEKHLRMAQTALAHRGHDAGRAG